MIFSAQKKEKPGVFPTFGHMCRTLVVDTLCIYGKSKFKVAFSSILTADLDSSQPRLIDRQAMRHHSFFTLLRSKKEGMGRPTDELMDEDALLELRGRI